jgi:hypothetical protein
VTAAPVREEKGPAPQPARDPRVEATARLLGQLATVLGSRHAVVPVELDDAAGRAVRARGAHGLLRGGHILLDPASYDPGSDAGRHLLAHEATHAAQRAEVLLRPDRRRPSPAEAELEADRVAAAFVAGRWPGRLHAVLPAGAGAADTGAVATAADLRVRYPRLLDDIIGRLHPTLWLSASDIDEVLQRLGAIPLPDGIAVVRALAADDRGRLARAVSAGHARRHRDGFVVMLGGLDTLERAELASDRYLALDLHGISRSQYDVVIDTVRSLPENKVRELLADESTGAVWRRLISVPPGELDLVVEPATAPAGPSAEDRAAAAARSAQLARDDRVVAALAQLRLLPQRPTRAQAIQALQTLRGLADTPASRPLQEAAGRTAAPPPADERQQYVVARLDAESVVDRIVGAVDDEAVQQAGLDATMRAVLRNAPGAASRRVESLLYSLISDWFVTAAAAIRAFTVMYELASGHPERIPPLDVAGYVDRMFNNLPETFLYREDVREQTRVIMAARAPTTLFDKARDLLSYGLFDWAVTARDAFLAFQLVRALPAPRRQAFQDLDGGTYWNRMIREMSASMRAATDLATTRGPFEAREVSGIRLQLSDDALWSPPHAAEVRVLVSVAVSLGDHRWLFERSRQVNAYRVRALQPIVEQFALYDPDRGRSDYRPMPVQGLPWYREGPFAFLTGLGRGVGILAGGRLYIPSLSPFSVGLNRLDVGEAVQAQREVGTLFGLLPDSASSQLTVGPRESPGENIAEIWYSGRSSTLEVRIATLRLSSYAFLAPNKTIRFGSATFTNLDLHAELDASGWRDIRTRIDLSGMSLQDVLFTSETNRTAVANLDLRPVAVTSAATPEQVAGGPTRGVTIGLVDTLLAGLSTRVGLSAGSIRIDGMYVDGTRIASIELEGLRVTTQADRTEYLRGLVAVHRERLDRTTDPAQRDRYHRRLDLVADELSRQERFRELQRRAATGPMSEQERAEQDELAGLLRRQENTGAVVSLRSARIRGVQSAVAGAVAVESLDLLDVVGGGELSRPLFELLSDPALVRRFVRAGVPASSGPDVDTIGLDLGDVELRELDLAGQLPSVASLTRDRDAAPAGSPARAELTRLIPFAETYEVLSRRLERSDAPLDAGDRQQLLFARQELVRYARTHVGRVSLSDATVGLSRRGATGFTARELRAERISSGQLEIDSVAGHNVSVSANRDPQQSGLAALTEAGLRAGSLQVRGIRYAGQQAPLAALTVTGAELAAQRVPGGWHVAPLTLGSLTIDRLDLTLGAKHVRSPNPVVIADVTGDVTLETAAADSFDLTAVTIARLRIGRVDGRAIAYSDGTRTLDISTRLRELIVTGVRWDVGTNRPTRVAAPGHERDRDAGTVRLGAIDQLAVSGTFAAGLQGALRVRSAPAAGSALEVRVDDEGGLHVSADLGAIDLPRLRWSDAAGTVLDADRPVSLRGVTARIRPHLGADLSPQSVDLDLLHVDELRAEHLCYTDTGRTVELTRPAGSRTPALTLRGIDLRDVHWRPGQATLPFRLDVAGADLALASYVAGDLRVTGATLRAAALHVQRGADGGLAVAAGELTGSADISRSGASGHVTLDRGALDVEYRDGELRFGRDGQPGLRVARLAAERFALTTPSVTVTGVGPVAVEGLAVQAVVRAGRTADGKPDWTRFRAEFPMLRIDAVRLRGLTVVVPRPAGDARVELPPGRDAVISNLELRPQVGETVFAVDVDTAPAGRTQVSGLVDVQRLVVPRLTARLGTALRVETGILAHGITAGLARSGEVTLDLVQLVLLDTDVRAGLTPGPRPATTPPVDLNAVRRSIQDAIRNVRSLFRFVQGNLDATLDAPYVGAVPLTVPIVDGSIDPFALEGQLPAWLNTALDFELSDGQLKLMLDPRPLTMAVSPVGGLIAGKFPLLTWDLSTGEYRRLERTHQIEVDRLVDFAITRYGRPLLAPIPGTGGPSSPSSLRIRDLDARLRITNPSPLPLNLVTPPAAGSAAAAAAGVRVLHVVLARDALLGLRVRGNIGAGAGFLRTEVVGFDLDRLQLSYDDPATGLRVDVSTGAAGVTGVRAGTGFTDFDPTGVAAGALRVGVDDVHVRVRP